MNLRAGKLRHRIAIKRPANETGTRGEVVGSLSTILKDEPAAVVALSGRELEQARAVYPAATSRVELRAHPRAPVIEGDVVEFAGRNLHVYFVNDLENRGIEWHLTCGEVR
jgi:head-tail adaptor